MIEKDQDHKDNGIRWDKKQGTPKDPEVAEKVERGSGRYGASEQGEQSQRLSKPRSTPKSKPRRGRRILSEL